MRYKPQTITFRTPAGVEIKFLFDDNDGDGPDLRVLIGGKFAGYITRDRRNEIAKSLGIDLTEVEPIEIDGGVLEKQ